MSLSLVSYFLVPARQVHARTHAKILDPIIYRSYYLGIMVASVGQDKAVVKTTKPLPRAIQLVMTISSLLEPSTTASMKTIGEHGVDRFFAWIKLVFLPSVFIALAALLTYGVVCDDDYEVISGGGGGFVFLAVLVLPNVYLAVVPAAGGHLDLFAPQTPYAAWEAVFNVGVRAMAPPSY
jgi:hypothetical protein